MSFTDSKSDCEKFEVILYSSVCEAVDLCLNSTKIPKDLKQEAQNISCAIESIIEEDKNKIVGDVNAVSIFEQATPGKWQRSSKKSNS